MSIVAVDPGLATFGWAVLVNGVPLRVGYYETSRHKTRLPAEDFLVRTNEVTQYVWQLLSDVGPEYVVSEAFSYPRHARSAVMLGAGFVVVATACKMLDIPMLQVSRKEVLAFHGIKVTARGKKKRKAEIKAKVLDLVDCNYAELEGWPNAKGKREHPADALVTGLCAVGDPKFLARVRAQHDSAVVFAED